MTTVNLDRARPGWRRPGRDVGAGETGVGAEAEGTGLRSFAAMRLFRHLRSGPPQRDAGLATGILARSAALGSANFALPANSAATSASRSLMPSASPEPES